jgi:hypothetical protein
VQFPAHFLHQEAHPEVAPSFLIDGRITNALCRIAPAPFIILLHAYSHYR